MGLRAGPRDGRKRKRANPAHMGPGEAALHRANPTLIAGQINVDEAKVNEITAFLRPNPDFTLSSDGTQIAP